ncbi:hypothetical protein B0H16DRAFT_1824040 [Mycena metata]|uniref:Uncharacterized protein n=1 Tax=Mycena metata TaxID=1033252 RepID=A0AAD7J679_9AGAR|nr:hypothetical protein B0H16DRAFT_1824040 [Mycena metata]
MSWALHGTTRDIKDGPRQGGLVLPLVGPIAHVSSWTIPGFGPYLGFAEHSNPGKSGVPGRPSRGSAQFADSAWHMSTDVKIMSAQVATCADEAAERLSNTHALRRSCLGDPGTQCLVSPSPNHAPVGAINNFAVAGPVEDTTDISNTPILPVASAYSNSPPTLPVKPPRSQTSIAVVAASVAIGVAFLMVVAVALWLDARQALTPSNTVSTRQLYISNQVNRAREKVAELEAETSTLLRQSSRSSDSHQEGIPSGTDELSADDLNSSGIYERLERAIQQIEGLNDRIRELERERRSSWALGLSDEAPPGYIE